MTPKNLIILVAILTGTILGFYVLGEESKELEHSDPHAGHNHDEPTVQVVNRGEPNISLEPEYEQIGRLQANIPDGWKREQPSSSMRIAQFQIPGKNGVGELIIFSGIGGTVDANLDRWYGQFKSETKESISKSAIKTKEKINGMEVTFSYVVGTYLKSSMGMGGSTTEMSNYVLMAAIVIAPDGPYFFKGIGPKTTMDFQKDNFTQFIHSLEKL